METGYVPISKAALEVPEYKTYLEENPTAEAATLELDYGISAPSFVGYGEYRNELMNTMDDVLVNDADEQEALTELNKKAEEIISNNN